ncbi:hypothetical protein ORI20_30655 [Mycobacterium sp. CVI_P3]|uniref:YbjN domain-containing protein n=1 Tax=Mycobacterium pinniadriaticum TaxID=2994102 RepID=A0ABT3SNG5_9MYCO|nr:YbjN domain-containing protein [Mycobacterium pinniadriaticum]MCX2934633.1 hypothetical protein [Mycobacterium pinniadriaticum]MCX2941056.1 hypothetical protein [Mycobacterium pinniadriaticum]
MTTANGIELIEGYLQSRQVRYFRGHHEDESFFLVSAYHGRLHVHLRPSGPGGAAVQISITADRYYPAVRRARVAAMVEQWTSSDRRLAATVFESSDPSLVGVLAGCRYRAGAGDFGSFVDQAVQSAIDLFGRLRVLAASPSADTDLLDAG